MLRRHQEHRRLSLLLQRDLLKAREMLLHELYHRNIVIFDQIFKLMMVDDRNVANDLLKNGKDAILKVVLLEGVVR